MNAPENAPGVSSVQGDTPGGGTPEGGESQGTDTYHGLAPSRRTEVIVAVVALAVFACLVFLANNIDLRAEPGGIDPRWWPRALGVVGVVLSGLLVAVASTRDLARDDVEQTTAQGRIRFAIALGATVAFILLWPVITFFPATVLYVLGMTYCFGGRGWKVLTLFPVGITVFLYLLFHTLLKVPL